MGTKSNGQNKLLIATLFLILMLSYCAIPSKDTTHHPEEEQTTEHAKEAAVHHEEPADDHAAKEAVHKEEAKHEDDKTAAHEEKAVEHKTQVVEGHAKEAAEEKPQASEAHVEAASNFPDLIAMNDPGYKKHKKGIVQFTHKKHAVDYKAGCGDCHHDDSGQPLELKMGDDVESCIDCHSEASKAPKPKDKKTPLTKEEKLEYHAEALHMNCIACHKAYNKEHKTKAAPTSCGKCHPKK